MIIHCEPVFLVIIDTSKNYQELYELEQMLEKKIPRGIDTMRTYSEEENMIGLWNADDPMIKGHYVKRAQESYYYSIEYSKCYESSTGEPGLSALEIYPKSEVSGTTMFLLAGIYSKDQEDRARSDLEKYKALHENAYLLIKHDLQCFWVRTKSK